MRTLLLFFALFFAAMPVLVAQETRLGKVTIDELKATQSQIDSSAVGEFMFKKGTYTILFDPEGTPFLNTEIEVKVKIYKKEGYELADFSFPVYVGYGSSETGSFSDAFTYNLVNGKIQKTKLGNEGKFKEKINNNVELRKISMPDVKEGSIIEFKYTAKTKFISEFEWQFQHRIPVIFNQLTFIHPENLTYSAFQKSSMNLNQDIKSLPVPGRTFNEVRTTYTVHNLKPYRNESFVSNINNYIPSISYELASIRYGSGMVKHLSLSWEDVAKNIYDNDAFGKELAQKGYFEEDLKAALSNVSGANERIVAAYEFVKNHMNWNERNGVYCDLGVKKAYKDKVGNVADINLMLVAVFRHLGLNCDPVLVSTRNNGIAFFPNRTAYNYVIAAVRTDNGILLFDATSKNAMANLMPLRTLNWVGRMITKDGRSLEIELMPTKPSKLNYMTMITLAADGSISGKSREQLYDYNALNFRDRYANLSIDSHIERLENNFKGVDFEDFVLNNKTDLSKPINLEYAFKSDAAVDIIGNNMYIKPLLFHKMESNPFVSEEREFPVDFTFPRNDKYTYTYNIPEGFEVESLPETFVLSFQNDLLNFKYQVVQRGQTIQVSSSLDLNVPIITSNYYPTLKEFFAKVVEKMNEQIVLKKV